MRCCLRDGNGNAFLLKVLILTHSRQTDDEDCDAIIFTGHKCHSGTIFLWININIISNLNCKLHLYDIM